MPSLSLQQIRAVTSRLRFLEGQIREPCCGIFGADRRQSVESEAARLRCELLSSWVRAASPAVHEIAGTGDFSEPSLP